MVGVRAVHDAEPVRLLLLHPPLPAGAGAHCDHWRPHRDGGELCDGRADHSNSGVGTHELRGQRRRIWRSDCRGLRIQQHRRGHVQDLHSGRLGGPAPHRHPDRPQAVHCVLLPRGRPCVGLVEPQLQLHHSARRRQLHRPWRVPCHRFRRHGRHRRVRRQHLRAPAPRPGLRDRPHHPRRRHLLRRRLHVHLGLLHAQG
mmetsp:Transcript_18328/g.70802  ORF Transcript_18328/g.70802 Transcript_18328/m.70802 type:complete len:200 (+) Transcript_18328:330-929(+)